MYSSSGQVCPACAREGTETFLGHDPFASQRLQPDFTVDTIARKLLLPDVRWHLKRAQCRVWPQGARHDSAFTTLRCPGAPVHLKWLAAACSVPKCVKSSLKAR